MLDLADDSRKTLENRSRNLVWSPSVRGLVAAETESWSPPVLMTDGVDEEFGAVV